MKCTLSVSTMVNANAKQAEDFVLKACEHYRKFLIRQRNRDER